MSNAMIRAVAGSPLEGPMRVVSRTFDLMAIANEVLNEAGVDRSDAFMALLPPESLVDLDDQVYRAHARELVERIANGAKLEPATDAELLAVVADASLDCPLGEVGRVVFERLFVTVMGKAPHVEGDPPREPWPRAADDEIAAMRKRYSVKRGV